MYTSYDVSRLFADSFTGLTTINSDYFRLESDDEDRYPYIVIPLKEKAYIEVVSIVCPHYYRVRARVDSNSYYPCEDTYVEIFQTVNWNTKPDDWSNGQTCTFPSENDSDYATTTNTKLSNKYGADAKCGFVGQYVLIKNRKVLALKNVAIYAGYDCYRVNWVFKVDHYDDTAT